MHAGTKNRCLTTWLYSIRPVLDGKRGEGEGGSRARRTSRAAQGRGDIASKQKGSPFRTDYNKLTTLIERKGKLSALFACNAMPIKANASVTLDSLRCSTELVGSTSTESR